MSNRLHLMDHMAPYGRYCDNDFREYSYNAASIVSDWHMVFHLIMVLPSTQMDQPGIREQHLFRDSDAYCGAMNQD